MSPPRRQRGRSRNDLDKPAEREVRPQRVDPDRLDTIQEREKRAGRQRPPPRRGMDAIVDKSLEREPALVVGALPAHVEVLPERELEAKGRDVSRDSVQIVRVHPALIAAIQSPLVVGDRISVALLPNGQRYAVELQPRTTLMARPEVDRGRLPQPLVANADSLVIVVAMAEPLLKPGLVDRFLVAAAAAGLEPRICATKLDLDESGLSEEVLEVYERLGIPVHRTSTRSGVGLAAVREGLANRFSVLVGQSGVGKSSIVRAILPEAPIAVAEISQATGKGKHTTTVTRYYQLPEGGAVVDTPGLRELGLWGATREHLHEAFPDISALAAGCRFDDCRHENEPGCAVLEAAEAEELDWERLLSFRKLSEEIDQRLRPGFGKPGGPTIQK